MARPCVPPIFIDLPAAHSTPDTPSETPGTPTSTTTSLSALSTTAIKDGHRGQPLDENLNHEHGDRTSLARLAEERADRISRLAGLERALSLPRAYQDPGGNPGGNPGGSQSRSPQTTPTSTTGFPPNFPATQHLIPAYFDSNGQPVAITKISTVGTASATDSLLGELDERRTVGDHDEDIRSTDTNFREGGSVASVGTLDGDGVRSIGGSEDRMSDDGSSSLVGFGEGAGSTVSGPIYYRYAAPAYKYPPLERGGSGLDDMRRDKEASASTGMGGGGDTAVGASASASTSAMQERREARMVDGVAADAVPSNLGSDYDFVDTTFRGPVTVGRQSTREAGQRFGHQRLDSGDGRAASSSLGSPGRDSDHTG